MTTGKPGNLTHKKYRELTPGERAELREDYRLLQGDKCFYCTEPLTGEPSPKVQRAAIDKRLFPRGMFDYPIHLQHNHKTGITEGAVHARCNAYMWQYEGR